jgi:hypothetical protein
MGLTATEIENHPRVRAQLRQRAADLLDMHVADPRSGGIFATHQRWLLAHIALVAHFEAALSGGVAGMYASTVAATAVAEGVSSRNTAESFLREMVRYGFVESAPSERDLRIRRLTISSFAIRNVAGWFAANLATVDALDAGDRAKIFLGDPSLFARAESVAARGFLSSPAIRRPGPTFMLFTTVDEGGAVMDRLFASHADAPDGEGRYLTRIASLADFGGHIRLSRSHLTRKLRAAEALGSLGWQGERGKSRIWVSEAFLREYVARQAAELAAIEAGFQQALAEVRRGGSEDLQARTACREVREVAARRER